MTVCAAALIVWREGGLALLGASSLATLFAMIAVAIAEHYAFEVNSYVFSLHRAGAGTWMRFVRTGLWPVLAIVGLLLGVMDGVGGVLLLWTMADIAVIVWGWHLIGDERRRQASKQADAFAKHRSLWQMWKEGCAFYLAAALLSCMQYAERFIAAPFLAHDELGRYVFAWSVANAVQTLSLATFAVTSSPALARAVSMEPEKFVALKQRAIARTLCGTVLLSVAVMSAQSVIFGRPPLPCAIDRTQPACTNQKWCSRGR